MKASIFRLTSLALTTLAFGSASCGASSDGAPGPAKVPTATAVATAPPQATASAAHGPADSVAINAMLARTLKQVELARGLHATFGLEWRE